MAINMGLTLFLFILCLKTVRCIISQEHLSTEDINKILDKLILQTHVNETDGNPIPEVKDSYTPVVDTQRGNDSNIYYFNTHDNTAPRINHKSSSEMLHVTVNSNKTVQSFEVANEDHEQTSEHESFPGASKITRRSFIGVENQKQFIPSLHGEQDSSDTDENYNILEDLIKNEIVSDLSTVKENKQISLTQDGQPNQHLSLLQGYPEIIIDHVTYDDEENDKKDIVKIKSHDTQHIQNVVKGQNDKVFTRKPSLKSHYNIREEDIKISENTSENFRAGNYLVPEMKVLIDAIIQKKVMHDALLRQTTESESRKQSMILEKILQRLPEKKHMTNNVKASYLLRQGRISPSEIELLSDLRSSLETLRSKGGNHFTKSYFNMPSMPNKWEIHNRLLKTLLRMYRPDALKRTRFIAGLIDRIMSNIDYRPVYYNLYKK